MAWDVESSNEYLEWWRDLTLDQQKSIERIIGLLIEYGPTLPNRYSKKVISSRHGRMRELRVQSDGRPLRILYAFDPRRVAILLIGGGKIGNGRFCIEYVRMADRIYDSNLDDLRQEGLIP
jgi:hypothetical protein